MMTVNRILILLAVDILGDRSHGNHVAGLIINTTRKHQTLRGGVYVTLHRMRDMGWLRQLVGGDKTPRPFYRLTAKGRRLLEAQLKEFEDMAKLYRKHRTKKYKPGTVAWEDVRKARQK